MPAIHHMIKQNIQQGGNAMKITFLGAAHEVTGSCTLLEVGDKKGLVDCGMEQGEDVYYPTDINLFHLFVVKVVRRYKIFLISPKYCFCSSGKSCCSSQSFCGSSLP